MPSIIFMLYNWPAMSNVGRFFYILLLVVFVAALAFWSTKLLASARGGKLRGSRRNLEIIESVGVGAQTMVQIVRAGAKYLVIGVSKERITFLAELGKDDITLGERQGAPPEGAFASILKRFAARDGAADEDTGDGDEKVED